MFMHTLKLLAAASAPLAISAPAVSAADPATVSPFVSPVHTEICRHDKPHAPGTTLHRIESGGLDRQYLLYVPKGYDGASPVPLVFDFHGSGSNPEEELQVSGMASAAERHGFVVLLPVAAVPFPLGGFTWNVPPGARQPDDVRFARDALRDAEQRVCIDDTRVYAAGFSGGARLASQIACARPDLIAALGAVGGLRAPPLCRAGSVPIVAFHGSADPINPYAGGGPKYWGYGVEAALRAWIERNDCQAATDTIHVTDEVVKRVHAGCRGDATVVFYSIAGGGHTWPGSRFPFPEERFGKTTRDIDATTLMVEFFQTHVKPATTGATSSTRSTR
jgi:polyhydroxybutyrate depolymerase